MTIYQSNGVYLQLSDINGAAVPSTADDKYVRESMSTSTPELKSQGSSPKAPLSATAGDYTEATTTSVTEKLMYTCQSCNKQFVNKDVLTQHQKLYCTSLSSARRSRNTANHIKKLLNNYGKLS